MNVWIVNPFDELPNATDVPLRYWTLCATLAAAGHSVIWWSSDFSHLKKARRSPCAPTDGFSVRLIATPGYRKNIGLARLRDHRCFARQFYKEATAGLEQGTLAAPDRIVVSLPPLGVAERAFQIRERLGGSERCQVVVDIMDAWPETFYRAFPKPLRQNMGRALLAPLHRSARAAYAGADRIAGVGQSYLDLAARSRGAETPTHLCYHGTELNRFPKSPLNPRKKAGPGKAVYLGSMGHGYDLWPLIKLARRWKRAGATDWQLHLAGSGPQAAELQAYADTEELHDQVFFHGYLGREAIDELLAASHLAFVTNRRETWVACPYKAGEYAAAGLPVLSCLGGEFADLLETWDAGLSYEEGDLDSLEAAFREISADPADLLRRSQNARAMAEALFDRAETYPRLAEFITR